MTTTDKARRGIYAAAITPLTAEGGLDHDKLVAYCQYLMSADGGCDGVAPMGTTGEASSMAMKDRLQLPDHFAKAGIAQDRVIFGTGTPSVSDTVALTRSALDAGYANVLVLPPFYYKSVSDEGLYAAYSRMIERVGRNHLRVYLYHIPQMSATPLSVSLVLRLRDAFGPIVAGLKDSTGDFAVSRTFIEATGGVDAGFDVYPASEAMLWDGLAIGSAGTISGTTNAFGALAQAAVQAPEGSARDQAQARVAAARKVGTRYSVFGAMKQIAAWRTGDDSWLRLAPPLQALSADDTARLKADLAKLDLTF